MNTRSKVWKFGSDKIHYSEPIFKAVYNGNIQYILELIKINGGFHIACQYFSTIKDSCGHAPNEWASHLYCYGDLLNNVYPNFENYYTISKLLDIKENVRKYELERLKNLGYNLTIKNTQNKKLKIDINSYYQITNASIKDLGNIIDNYNLTIGNCKVKKNTGSLNNRIKDDIIIDIIEANRIRQTNKIILYHQTDYKSAFNISTGKYMLTGKQGTLGPGVYFTEDYKTTDVMARKRGVIIKAEVILGNLHKFKNLEDIKNLKYKSNISWRYPESKLVIYNNSCGKIIHSSSLILSRGLEYCIYNPDQIKILNIFFTSEKINKEIISYNNEIESMSNLIENICKENNQEEFYNKIQKWFLAKNNLLNKKSTVYGKEKIKLYEMNISFAFQESKFFQHIIFRNFIKNNLHLLDLYSFSKFKINCILHQNIFDIFNIFGDTKESWVLTIIWFITHINKIYQDSSFLNTNSISDNEKFKNIQMFVYGGIIRDYLINNHIHQSMDIDIAFNPYNKYNFKDCLLLLNHFINFTSGRLSIVNKNYKGPNVLEIILKINNISEIDSNITIEFTNQVKFEEKSIDSTNKGVDFDVNNLKLTSNGLELKYTNIQNIYKTPEVDVIVSHCLSKDAFALKKVKKERINKMRERGFNVHFINNTDLNYLNVSY